MKNANTLNIKNFAKVCKVSSVISQVCQIQERGWLEKRLLNQWSKTVLTENDKDYEDEEVAFILAKSSFIEYLKSDRNVMNDDPITPFLIDVIKYV